MTASEQPSQEGEVKPRPTRNILPGGKVVFNQRYEVDLDKKLDTYSNGYSTAFSARDKTEDKSLVAFIADPVYPARFKKAQAYAEVMNPALPQLLAAGVLDLPAHAGQRLVFLYEDTMGRPVVTPQEGLPIAFGWRSERVLEKVLGPILLALKDLRDHDLVHGGIRLNNIFDTGKEKFANVMLGECLSSPASIAQPVLFEPMERALAQPSGRGAGLPQDDLYALGVLTALLVRTKDPLKKRTDEDIILSKMLVGTYATLVSPDDHFSGSILEFVRGTLIDDARQRWTLDDALSWLDGRRLSPKQPAKKKKAPRSLMFAGKNIFYAEVLAREVLAHPNEAVEASDSGLIEQWIERSINDEDMVLRYQRALKSAQDAGRGPTYAERLASRIAIAVDPDAPVRFKNVSFTLDGLGGVLAEAFITGRDLPVLTELLSSGIIQSYIGVLTELNYDVSAHSSKQDACRNFMRAPGIGFGLERVLYHLNEDVQCLSPLVARFYVRSPDDFLLALDALLAEDKHPKNILDRHTVAFLAAKDSKLVEPYLYDISSPLPFRQILGTLQVLASVQRFYRAQPVPRVGKWLLPQLDSIINRYHDKETRETLKEKVRKLAESGELSKLLALLDSKENWQRDVFSFRQAIGEYRVLDLERYDLELKLQSPRRFGARYGREAAVVAAGIVGVLVMIGFVLLYISGGGIL